jgi:hypothetical protein
MYRRSHKRRYAPLYKTVRTPNTNFGVGPVDGAFTRLVTRAKIRYNQDTVAYQRHMLPIPVNYLYFGTVSDEFQMFPNVFSVGNQAAGVHSFLEAPSYTGWGNYLKPYVTYRISGVAINIKFYVPYNDTKPVIFKIGILGERDFGTTSVTHLDGVVTNVIGATPWYSQSLLHNSTNWKDLNQKAYRQTVSQPGTQTYVTVSAYIDAAKLFHWDRSYYKAQSAITGGITSSAGEMTTVTQPTTRAAAQFALEVVSNTDGTPVTTIPSYMFDMSLTYFVRAVDPHTLVNMANSEV